nr:restriction endonuclease subunit S [uncultured Albidiferax sp.]
MSFPRYPTYKDSGVEWLGEVPGHWEVVPLKFIANVQTGVAKGKDNTGKETIQVPYLRVANVQDGHLDLKTVAEIEIPAEDLQRYRLQAGDVLMNEGGDFDKLGRGHIWDASIEPCIHQNHVFAVRPHGVGSVWLNAITGSQYAQFYFMTRSKQSTNLASISSTNLMELPVVLPPTAEQTQIAAFLDRETAKIDGLVAEQRRLMELLKEKRQAVISHAVTQGLNPHVPMKPSGIEWLGDVPAHWAIAPLRYVVSLRSGGTPSKTNTEYWDGNVPWASSKDLKVDALADTQDHITQKAIDDGAADLVSVGSLLIVVRGMILVHSFPVVKVLAPMAINQDLKALSPSARLDGNFLEWLLRGSSRETLGQVDEAAHGTKVLRMEAWTAMALPVPPIAEQLEIVAAITHSVTKIDTLTTEAQRAIDLLQERRTALVSAAVTGQIDVRGLAAVATH